MTMESFQQRQDLFGSSFFQPIQADPSYEAYEEEQTLADEYFNKSIFRQPDEVDDAGSPPTVTRANPIGMDYEDERHIFYDDDELNSGITPYPYSPCREEMEDRLDLVSEMPQLASLSSAESSDSSIDYSCYFGGQLGNGEQPFKNIISSSRTKLCHVQQRRVSSPAQISDTESTVDGH
mmetsp:Transcript_27525/g.40667  ORF Transcript_27525/g.40667 Transcript_27525/m.40667 type:complete len:179 (-) Transcript_27525:59-595(-)